MQIHSCNVKPYHVQLANGKPTTCRTKDLNPVFSSISFAEKVSTVLIDNHYHIFPSHMVPIHSNQRCTGATAGDSISTDTELLGRVPTIITIKICLARNIVCVRFWRFLCRFLLYSTKASTLMVSWDESPSSWLQRGGHWVFTGKRKKGNRRQIGKQRRKN